VDVDLRVVSEENLGRLLLHRARRSRAGIVRVRVRPQPGGQSQAQERAVLPIIGRRQFTGLERIRAEWLEPTRKAAGASVPTGTRAPSRGPHRRPPRPVFSPGPSSRLDHPGLRARLRTLAPSCISRRGKPTRVRPDRHRVWAGNTTLEVCTGWDLATQRMVDESGEGARRGPATR